jgi:hypothetical protein
MANLLHREVILPLNEQGDHTTSFDPRRAQFFGGAYAYSSSDPFLRNRFLTWFVALVFHIRFGTQTSRRS